MNHNEKGFTLLEIIVALAILSLGFLTLVQLFSGGLRLATESDDYLKGLVLAQNQFQRLESEDFDPETLQGEFEEPGYFWEAKIASYSSELRDSAFPVKKVSVRVYWDQEGREKEINLVSVATVGTTRLLTANQLDSRSGTTEPQNDSDNNNPQNTSAENNTGSTNPNPTQPSSSPITPNGGSIATGQ